MTKKQISYGLVLSAALILAGLLVQFSKSILGTDLTYWGFLASAQTAAWLHRVLVTLSDLAIALGVIFLVKFASAQVAMNRLLAGEGVLAHWRYAKENGGQSEAVLARGGALLSGSLFQWKALWKELDHAELRQEQGSTKLLVWISSSVMFFNNQYGLAITVPPGHENEAAAALAEILAYAQRPRPKNAQE